jgi:hypothetical protein
MNLRDTNIQTIAESLADTGKDQTSCPWLLYSFIFLGFSTVRPLTI